jgi:hypothetical protein
LLLGEMGVQEGRRKKKSYFFFAAFFFCLDTQGAQGRRKGGTLLTGRAPFYAACDSKKVHEKASKKAKKSIVIQENSSVSLCP